MSDTVECKFCKSVVKRRGLTYHLKSKKCQKAQNINLSIEDKYKLEIEQLKSKYKKMLKNMKKEYESKLREKDLFIQSLAKEPKTVNNNNTFSINNYFDGNKGFDFNDTKMIQQKVEECKMLMDETIETYGLDNKQIKNTRQKQVELFFLDEKTGKWNVIKTDSSRGTYTLCRTINDNVILVKDPNGETLRMVLNQVDKHNNKIFLRYFIDKDSSKKIERKYVNNTTVELIDSIPHKSLIEV